MGAVPKEDEMRRKLLGGLVLGTVIAGATFYTGKVQATPASGFVGTTIAVGRFGDIDASNHMVLPNPSGHWRHKDFWLSFQKTKGPSDLYVQNNTWQPGGTTGWHTHPGHSLIIVTAGTVTTYEGDDRQCRPHVYTAGMGFVDEGGDHVHVIRNEDSVEARTIAVQLIPAGATRREDADGNPACPF
jgi:quercetin dioxygenase-like cupin family protein